MITKGIYLVIGTFAIVLGIISFYDYISIQARPDFKNEASASHGTEEKRSTELSEFKPDPAKRVS